MAENAKIICPPPSGVDIIIPQYFCKLSTSMHQDLNFCISGDEQFKVNKL